MKFKHKQWILSSIISAAVIFSFAGTASAASNNTNFSSQQNNEFVQAYNEGRQKGILNNSNMTESDFIQLCKDSVFPAYLNYSKDNPTVSFSQYIAEDNYEVPELSPGDDPTTVNANDDDNSNSSSFGGLFTNFIAAHSGYSMKAGDILICYGKWGINNSLPNFPGHAAIATSSKYVLEMPGTLNGKRSRSHNARSVSKYSFFKDHTGSGNYVAVFRIKNHPKYADSASTYAYRYMYKKDNPFYSIAQGGNLNQKSPSYCSKYVYYAYLKGAISSSVKHYSNPWWIRPHNLMNYFSSSFHPAYIHKVTRP